MNISVGDVIAEKTYDISRDTLVRYAGASGDFNSIHYRDDVAEQVGLPGVLAHGMLTMGIAIASVVEWIGDSARVLEFGVRFTRPVVVDPASGQTVTVVARVGALEEGIARIDLTVTVNGETVLGKAQARVAVL